MRIKNPDSIMLSILIIIAFLFKGGFDSLFLFPLFIWEIVVFIYVILTRSSLKFNKPLIITLSAYLFYVICSFCFFAINKGEAFYEIFRVIFYFLGVIVVQNLLNIKDLKASQNNIFTVLSGIGFLLAIINIFMFPIVSTEDKELFRLQYIIEYANTLAIIMLLSVISSITLLKEKLKVGNVNLLYIAIFFQISCLILTYSRMVLILSLLALFIFLILIRSKQLVLESGWIILNSVVFSFLSQRQEALGFFALIIIVLFIMLVVRNIIDERILKKIVITFNKLKILKISLLTLLTGLALIFLIRSFGGNVLNRIISINFNVPELQERFAYYNDAIKIFKAYFLTGSGVGSWESLQYKFQTAIYSTKYVHSFIFQNIISYGIFGLLLIIIQMWLFVKFLKSAAKKGVSKLSITSITIIIISLYLHSFLDLNFEFLCINLIIWMIMGYLGMFSDNIININLKKHYKIIILTFSSILIIVYTTLYYSEICYFNGEEELNKGNFIEAKEQLETARYINKTQGKIYFLLSESYRNLSINDPSFSKKYFQEIENYLRFSGNQRNVSGSKISYYSMKDDKLNEVLETEKLIHVQPLIFSYYESYISLRFDLKKEFEKIGNLKAADEQKHKLLNTVKMLNEAKEKISTVAFNLKRQPDIALCDRLIAQLKARK